MAKSIILTLLLGISVALMGNPGGRTELRGIRADLVATYRSHIGVRELTGKNDGQIVEAYLRAVNLGRGFAWCAAFVAYCHLENGLLIPKNAAWSPSWFPANKIIQPEQAIAGDVFGIYYKHLKRIGHVGFIDEPYNNNSNIIVTVEGNTNGDGDREGDGVYRKRRSKAQIKTISRWVR